MTAIGVLLAHLRKPEVSEVQIASGRPPVVVIDGEPSFIGEEAFTSDDVVRLLFAAGGSRYVDGLGPRPSQWRTRVEGLGAIGVTALSTGNVVEARFVLRDAGSVPSVAPTPSVAPVGASSSGAPSGARSSAPPASVEGESRRRLSQAAPAVRSSAPPPASLKDGSSHQTYPRMDRALFGEGSSGEVSFETAPVTLADTTPRSIDRTVDLDLTPSFPTPPAAGSLGVAMALATTMPNLRAGGLADSGPLADLLTSARDAGASDVHLVPGRRATMRVGGRLVVRDAAIDATSLATLLLGYAPRRSAEMVLEGRAATFALEDPTLGRFRVHVVPSRAGASASLRPIPRATPSLLALGIDAAVTPVLARGARFVLVSSPLGNGRSTTLAAIVERLSAERASTIVTVEDPLEHVLSSRRGLVRQIEVGTHAADRAGAIESALGDAPDVLSLGDVGDAASVRASLRAVDRGALVLASLPASRPVLAADLLLAKLPDIERRRARSILASARAVVLAQRLVQPREGEGGSLGASMEAIDVVPDPFEPARVVASSSVPPGPSSVPPRPSTTPPSRPPSLRMPAASGLIDRVFKKGS